MTSKQLLIIRGYYRPYSIEEASVNNRKHISPSLLNLLLENLGIGLHSTVLPLTKNFSQQRTTFSHTNLVVAVQNGSLPVDPQGEGHLSCSGDSGVTQWCLKSFCQWKCSVGSNPLCVL